MLKRILLIVIMAVYLIASVFAVYISINKIADKYRVEDEIIAFFDEGKINLVIEDELINGYAPPVINGSEIFLPFDIVKKYIDPTIYKEPDGSVVTVTSDDKVIRMRNEDLQAFVNMEPVELDLTARYIDRVLYVPIVVFSDIFKIKATYNNDSDVVIIDYLRNYEHKGFISPEISIGSESENGVTTTKKTAVMDSVALRRGKSVKEPLYKEIGREGEVVDVYSIEGAWAKVRTEEGIIGYVESRFLTSSVDYSGITVNLIRRTPDELEEIVLAWQYIYMTTPPIEDFMEFDEINVYSPTWFTVVDADGTMDSRADMPYVEKVHESGARIWPLLSNTFNDIDMTSAVLNNPDARDNVIRQMISYVQLYKLDGINLDFENIYLKDRDAYTQFVREIMPYARSMGIKVSVDVGVPGGSDNYSLCYDHENLSREADYIMVMTYDQHWASSPVAGSQAQLQWVSDMLELTLEYVNPDKLVVGIPFYTRIWRDTDGVVKNVKTLGIEDTLELLEEKEVEMTWDDESGQYFATYTEEGSVYKMWIEEPESIALKADLVNTFNLRGVAVWQLSLGNEEAWESIGESLSGR
jgi:spore germination protein YaaH